MAFLTTFSRLSSSIGRKLLLFGLRHIDILDKDPADFVNVDIGTTTTLEVRDVGLHVKKLIALLPFNFPPELQLSHARASLFRCTFVLELGVPQILIEIDDVHVHARLVENSEEPGPSPRPQSPACARSSPRDPSHSFSSDDSSQDHDENIPTIDHLARSFIKEEPETELRELEEAIQSQSQSLQESVASSTDSDEGAGLGKPLGLPTFLRRLLNTALDRLQITATQIHVEVEDQLSPGSPDTDQEGQEPFVSLSFHLDSIAVDTVTSEGPQVHASPLTFQATESTAARRRLRIPTIYARLVSESQNFETLSRLLRPLSPTDDAQSTRSTRSAASYRQSTRRNSSGGQVDNNPVPDTAATRSSSPESARGEDAAPPMATSKEQREPEPGPPEPIPVDRGFEPLMSSAITCDDDRFADAASDDEMSQSIAADVHNNASSDAMEQSGVSGSSNLYNDDGRLDYSIENDLLANSAFDLFAAENGSNSEEISGERSSFLTGEAGKMQFNLQPAASYPFSNHRQGSRNPYDENLSKSGPVEGSNTQTNELDVGTQHQTPGQSSVEEPTISLPQEEDLTESRLFTHEDAESMYMSAMSGATSVSFGGAIPGGWDSNSGSSRGGSSDMSGSVPEAMVSGSILGPLRETDEGCETPRPGSPSSVRSLSNRPNSRSTHVHGKAKPSEESNEGHKLAKAFLAMDDIIVLFPLQLADDGPSSRETQEQARQPESSLSPPNLEPDSIFQDMPGTFSHYAFPTGSHGSTPSDKVLGKRPKQAVPSAPTNVSPEKQSKDSSGPISVEVGVVTGHIDLSTGRILYRLLNRVVDAIGGTEASEDKESELHARSTNPAHLEVTVGKLGLAWFEQLRTEIMNRTARPTPRPRLVCEPHDSIIRMNATAMKLSSHTSLEGRRSKIEIGQFVLASLDQEILCFVAQKPRSRRSGESSAGSLKNDIEIDVEQDPTSRITVVTRPVKLTCNLQHLDEALSSYGGFSGILELGNSISSNQIANSPQMRATARHSSPPRPRGVHFGDTPPPAPALPTGSSGMPKIDIQLGEVSSVLKGKSCAVQLQTTSVRAAARQSNVRVKVAEVKMSGPYADIGDAVAPLDLNIKGTTVNFLFTPEETDLSRLISMITPSKDPYENDEDILIDVLLRQRRKGSVLRIESSSVAVRVPDLGALRALEALGTELAKFSKVTRYLPDDDRPGILTMAIVQHLEGRVSVNDSIGELSLSLDNTSLAHVGFPALLATEIGKVSVCRNDELLLHELVKLRQQDHLPMIMVRIIGEEVEPLVKAKLFNVCAEYHVPTLMAVLGLPEDGKPDDVALALASSIATITGAQSPRSLSRQASETSSSSSASLNPLHVDLLLRACAIGLNPRAIPSKGLFVVTDAHFLGKQSTKVGYSIKADLRKASIHVIDDVNRIVEREMSAASASGYSTGQRQLFELREQGYVSLSSISEAKVSVQLTGAGVKRQQVVEVEFKNDLFVLESCADSTQTLIAVLNGLQPPRPPNTDQKYRTVVPLQNMMESFTGSAMAAPPDTEDHDFMDQADLVADEVPRNLEFVGSLYNSESLPTEEDVGDNILDEDNLGALATPPTTRKQGEPSLLESFQEQYEVTEEEFTFDDYFNQTGEQYKGKARKWDSTNNQYHLSNEFGVPDAPLRVRVRDVNVVWNLYDGYDWPRTRDIMAKAVDNLEARAEERRQRPQTEDDDDDFVEQDFLFNSVWIGVPIKDEKGALARRINRDIDDLASETGSYATSTTTATARPRSNTKPRRRRLKLERSKRKKITIDLSGVALDLVVYPPGSGETQNSLDVRIYNFEIFDHVPTSTWNKFVTSLIDPSQREMDRPMVDVEILTVKPVADLAATELVIRATVLPLRLHVDQDALDFMTRFFEFKDDSAPDSSGPSEPPFIQRLEVMPVKLKLDYKPKRVDYGGLRSGHTTEFMNFLILEGADVLLRHVIVYGITSLDKLHKTLNDIWMPDVKRNQLPTVLAGVAAVRPLVNVGSGVRDLVVVPMREYRKDGRLVRSLQKGVYAFARNTTSEVAKLGAKVAIGTQNMLEGAENLLNAQGPASSAPAALEEWDDVGGAEADDEGGRAVSNYANQQFGVKAGLRNAARYLERDLLRAKDAVIAIPAEVMEEGTGVGAARAIARRAPTVILRPALGATKAVGHALLGVGNALDKDSRRKVEDVSGGVDFILFMHKILTESLEIPILLAGARRGSRPAEGEARRLWSSIHMRVLE
ncbi:uncharacterized protein EI97DRAFT_375734 [Westerdykella ornata]|uniref:Autophagy-related protein 2 n=1 Tax=Westerdykella ornata TaxID=318751 RepID=A0A6A6JL26_WESOR|nr:uncharacterized protein EI97DRAFT_375734 [Westerdykella ornata]KAF2276964.1 hypothetical protein EI97DRAFT_375734 [Westerdykella ornata]